MSETAAVAVREATNTEAAAVRERWIEVCLVFSVVIFPLILRSFVAFRFGVSSIPDAAANWRYAYNSIEYLAGLALVWYILRRTGRTFSSLGLSWKLRSIFIGLGLMIACIFCTGIFWRLLLSGYSFWTGAAYRHDDMSLVLFSGNPALVALLLACVPFFEEVIVRGYLTTELAELTGSLRLATVVSVVVQGSYHLYQGWASALAATVAFLIFGVYYARTKKLLPVIVAHGAIDYYSFLVFLLYLRK